MDAEAAQVIAKALPVMLIGLSAIGEGMAFSSVFSAIGRNPKLEDTLFTKGIIAAAIIESTAIYGMVAFFLM